MERDESRIEAHRRVFEPRIIRCLGV